jgi:Zn-dependent peptidase ImmA (M78 family)
MKDSEKAAVLQDFVKFVYQELDIHTQPEIVFTEDTKFARGQKSFGSYNPSKASILVYTKNRNMADVLRTLAHELVHHKQNEEGYIEQKSGQTGSPIENEANSVAGILLRNYGVNHPMIYESEVKDSDILKEIIKRSK